MSGLPLAPRTRSGEVAEYVDDDQFASGQSLDKCGFEIVSLFWHSVKPGERNPYSGNQIHQMAHDDYVRFDGPDTRSNSNGMSNETLYRLISFHNFKLSILAAYREQIPLYLSDTRALRSFLLYGYPVVLGGVSEKSVYDEEMRGCPYSWEQGKSSPDYSHIILATGLGASDEVLCRDTANIGPDGRVRMGPRRYRLSSLKLTTATALVPSWLASPMGL